MVAAAAAAALAPVTEQLLVVADAVESLPFRLLLAGHCLYVSSLFTAYKDHWLLCYTVCAL